MVIIASFGENLRVCRNVLFYITPLDLGRLSSLVSVGPNASLGLRKSCETEPATLDGAVAFENEQVVKEGTKSSTEERSNHWNLDPCSLVFGFRVIHARVKRKRKKAHPEVVSTGRPDVVTVSYNVRDKTRAKVTSQVDGITRLPTEASTDSKDQEEKSKGHQVLGVSISGVGHGKNNKHQDTAGDEFGPPHLGPGKEGGRVSTEDASGRSGPSDGSDSRTFKVINGLLVGSEDDEGTSHGTEKLSKSVYGPFAPWVAAVKTVAKGDGWVQVTARFLAAVNAEHDGQSGKGGLNCQSSEQIEKCFFSFFIPSSPDFDRASDVIRESVHLPPAPRNTLIITLLLVTQRNLRNNTITKENHDTGSKELRPKVRP